MSQNHEKSEKIVLKQKLAVTIQKNSKILLSFLVLIVLVIIGLLIFNSLELKSMEKYTQQIEAIQDDYAELLYITDDNEKKEAEELILENLNTLIKTTPKNYALQRALFIRANIQYKNKNWDKAIEDFINIANDFSNSYLASISLINAASAFEEADKIDDAIETYKRVIEKYSAVSPKIPNVHFSIGRLYEQKEDFVAALTEYNNLVDTYPDGNWTNLARSRIIYLESR